MTTEELKPCPFCGQKPDAFERASDETPTGKFAVVRCLCGGFYACAHRCGDNMQEAITAWNTRASHPDTSLADELAEALSDVVECYNLMCENAKYTPTEDGLINQCRIGLEHYKKARGR